LGECLDQEMSDPTLVFVPALMRSIDAAHAEHGGFETVCPRIVQHILIRGSFRASVWGMKVERAILTDAEGKRILVFRKIAVAASLDRKVFQAPIDLIRRGVDQRGRFRKA